MRFLWSYPLSKQNEKPIFTEVVHCIGDEVAACYEVAGSIPASTCDFFMSACFSNLGQCSECTNSKSEKSFNKNVP